MFCIRGDGGSRTRVRRASTDASTCLSGLFFFAAGLTNRQVLRLRTAFALVCKTTVSLQTSQAIFVDTRQDAARQTSYRMWLPVLFRLPLHSHNWHLLFVSCINVRHRHSTTCCNRPHSPRRIQVIPIFYM